MDNDLWLKLIIDSKFVIETEFSLYSTLKLYMLLKINDIKEQTKVTINTNQFRERKGEPYLITEQGKEFADLFKYDKKINKIRIIHFITILGIFDFATY